MTDPTTPDAPLSSTALFVDGSVLGVPVGLRLEDDGAAGWRLQGRVTLDQPLAALAGGARDGAAALPDVLGRLQDVTGAAPDAPGNLGHLGGLRVGQLGVRVRSSPAPQGLSLELVADLAFEGIRLRVCGASRLGGGKGWIAGLSLRCDDPAPRPNALSGLVGTLAIRELGFCYCEVPGSEAPPPFDPRAEIESADDLLPASGAAPQSPALRPGFNFFGDVAIGNHALLDGTPAAPPGATSGQAPDTSGDTPKAKGTVGWIKVGKSLGPLTVHRIGLGLEAAQLVVKFDAGMRLGPLTLSLDGLGASYPLAQLADAPGGFWRHLQFGLDGAGVAFAGGPVRISGGLLRVPGVPRLQLDGALVIGTPTLTISALASYTTIDGQPSFFLFAALHKELGGPPFFFVTGLAVGLGLNRRLVLPPIEAVDRFPLLRAALDPDYPLRNDAPVSGASAMAAMSAELARYVQPSVGDMWLAAGVRFRSFGMIETVALLSVAFGTRTEIGLLGLSRIQVPPQVSGGAGGSLIAYAELALRVSLAPDDGVLSVQARLTERSYILRKEFRLRGGFALVSWFGGPHQGDFVVSLGGYHPHFKPPAHYPVPELVSFSSQVDAVTISGSCYFALCPAAIMAGARLSMVYDIGTVRAWFIASTDLLLQWKPVHYELTVAISVGVAVNLKVWFVRIRFSVELGAMLTLHGPPLGGSVRISLWVISFTVSFGEQLSVPPPLQWVDNNLERSFVGSFLPGALLRLAVVDGLIDDRAAAPADPTPLVNGHRLVIECSTQVPASALAVPGRSADSPALPALPPLGVRPMALARLDSPLTVVLHRLDKAGQAAAAPVQVQVDAYLTRAVPQALWGTGAAPAGAVPPGAEGMLIAGALMGVRLCMPEPTPSDASETRKLQELVATGVPGTPRGRSERTVPPRVPPTLSATEQAARRRDIAALLCGRLPQGPQAEALWPGDLARSAQRIFQAAPDTAAVGQVPPSVGV